jgi:acyl-CoA synthetase (AMP-forming)/AMP-acid ligase II
MRAFFGGSKMVMMRKWNTEEAVRLIMEEKVTVIGGSVSNASPFSHDVHVGGSKLTRRVPAVVSAIVQSPSLPKEASFETVFYGGAPPSKLLAAEVKARWPKAGLCVRSCRPWNDVVHIAKADEVSVQGYGMTETNAYVCSVAGQDYVERPDST